MATPGHRMIAGAAALVAVVGVVAVALDEGGSVCDGLRDRIAEIVPPADGPAAQRWEDIYVLQERVPEGLILTGEYRRLGCRPALPEPSTTIVAQPTDARLPTAADLGPTFDLRPSRGRIEGPGKTAYCDFEVPPLPRPTDRVDAWFTSQEALQEVGVEIIDYADETEAAVAFTTVAADAHCLYEDNQGDGRPTDVHVDGADRAVTIAYTNSNNTHGLAFARAGRSIVVVWVDVHFGAATTDFVPSLGVLNLVVDRVDGDAVTSTTSTTPPTNAGGGSLESATVAVRAACRAFYGYDSSNVERRPDADELAQKCDVPPVGWRSDCYADRPPAFVPGVGGCAYLGGYLAVWYGEQSFADGRVFRVSTDVWTVIPESD